MNRDGDWPFYKLHSLGTDAILMDHAELGPDEPRPTYETLARAILRRRRGVGASALVVLDETGDGTPRARVWNPAGEEVDDSFDALVCAARYLFDSGKADAENIVLQTRSGKRMLQVITSGDFRVNLGRPLESEGGPPLASVSAIRRTVLEAGTRRLSISSLAVPRPHAVLFSVDGRRVDLEALETALAGMGRKGAAYRALLARPISREAVMIHPSRRTGYDGVQASAAALAASAASGFTEREAAVIQGPGIRYADGDEETGEISVTAGAEYVYEGRWSGVVGDPEQAP